MMGGGMMNGFGFGGFGGFGLLGMILNLVITIGLIVGIIVLIVWLIRRVTPGGANFGSSTGLTNPQTPAEILRARYARGEITREEYQQILSDLR